MNTEILVNNNFDLERVIKHIKHYLPSQWALKDFIHHNSLHAFQHLPFFEGLNQAYEIFGYKITLTIDEYQKKYRNGEISENAVHKVLKEFISDENQRKALFEDMMEINLVHDFDSRIGNLRENWRTKLGVDMDAMVYPTLFRLLSNYLDQGIAIWKFPIKDKTFLEALSVIENNGLVSIFRRKRAREIFKSRSLSIHDLLEILVGKNYNFYENYLFDQQFEHQGWSGFVSEVEKMPAMLFDQRKISTKELIYLECLLEIDALDYKFGEGNWYPLEGYIDYTPKMIFESVKQTHVFTIGRLWQEAFEWTYYNSVLNGIIDKPQTHYEKNLRFQTIMCIDDRICSWRRHIEYIVPDCETYGTPGFFGLDMFFQPEGGKFYTKICPAPMTPKYLVKEVAKDQKLSQLKKKVTEKLNQSSIHHHEPDIHFSEHSHNSLLGWFVSQFIGFFSALKLVSAVLFPKRSAATSNPFMHMEKNFPLAIENHDHSQENGLNIGFTKEEMATRVYNMLKSIGLTENFAPIVYVIGHGSSSTNNPYYAGYECGACSGRAGSVNARVFSMMVNDPKVRELLREKGIDIPLGTIFLGGLHDTTQDVVQFFDKDISLSFTYRSSHNANKKDMREALKLNAKERSRRFENIATIESIDKIHNKIKRRSVSFFEPRPEYNHATNALCIVGRRDMTRGLFLDRRAFLNSYDYRKDSDGSYLQGILNAAAPVCGGINLEYYFSRTDNQKLGAGSKLPHNIIGLFGVANGIDGDLRPGLPAQMIEIHDPIRLMIIVEQFPEIILNAIQANPATYEWFANEWIHLICFHPTHKKMLRFQKGEFTILDLELMTTPSISSQDLIRIFETNNENIPVKIINDINYAA